MEEHTTNSPNMTRRSAVKGLSVAAFSVAATALGVAGAASLAGCSADGKDGEEASDSVDAKYYQLDKLSALPGDEIVAELEAEKLAYFDVEHEWQWAGTPADNPLAGPVWATFHASDVDADGFDVLSRDALENGTEVGYAELRWERVDSPADAPDETCAKLASACGLGDLAAEGAPQDGMSYIQLGSCSFAGEDGYWLVETIPDLEPAEEGEEFTKLDTATVRLMAARLAGLSIEEISAAYFPVDEPADGGEEVAGGEPAEETAEAAGQPSDEAEVDVASAE